MKILIYSLVGCPFSERAEEIVQSLKIKSKIIKVEQKNKQKVKEELKIETFPQIYMLNNSRKVSLGGCQELENYLEVIKILQDKNLKLYKLQMLLKHLH